MSSSLTLVTISFEYFQSPKNQHSPSISALSIYNNLKNKTKQLVSFRVCFPQTGANLRQIFAECKSHPMIHNPLPANITLEEYIKSSNTCEYCTHGIHKQTLGINIKMYNCDLKITQSPFWLLPQNNRYDFTCDKFLKSESDFR